MKPTDKGQEMVVYQMVLRYQGKSYLVDGYAWYDEIVGWRSAHEPDGVRTCEHDYAVYLPEEISREKEFDCDQKEIEVVDAWFYDKINNKKL